MNGTRHKSGKGKARFWATVILIGAAALVVMGNVLAAKFPIRRDVTALREQSLAPRTQQLLKKLEGPYRVVIAADLRAIDGRAKRNTSDVLEAMAKSTPNISSTWIDLGSASGIGAYKRLVNDLIERDSKLLSDQTNSINAAVGACTSISLYLNDSLSPALLSAREAISPTGAQATQLRGNLEQVAAGARLASRDLSEAVTKARDALKYTLGDANVPATDRASAALSAALDPVVQLLEAVTTQGRKWAASEAAAGPAAEALRGLLTQADQTRDQASLILDSMRHMTRADILRITDVLQRGSAALVIGPPSVGLSAVDVNALLPQSLVFESGLATADAKRRCEELLASSIGSLISPDRPIVVVVHGEAGEFLSATPIIQQLTERLRLHGVDVMEWAAVLNPEPKLDALNPLGKRPVVYVVLSPDAAAAAPAGGLSGAQRAAKLAEAINSIAGANKRLLIDLNPSVLPTYGDVDPVAGVLSRFGLACDSGRPVLREVVSPRGRTIETDLQAQGVEADSGAIGGAIRGLPVLLPWPVSLHTVPTPDKIRLETHKFLEIPASESVWAESQWLRVWQTPRDKRSLIPDLPVFDEGRDSRWPDGQRSQATQKWLLGVAVERFEVGLPSQRAVVIGSNSWFIDAVTQQATNADGRAAMRNPGNLEMFEAAVYWLAGQESLIAQSPTSATVPMIVPIDETSLVRVRLAIMLGLPLILLIMGGMYRMIRG
ncbi:MAG: hypothetical protein WC718_06465 [Phycisphaerales bacterium]|jgi:hypothetical protein